MALVLYAGLSIFMFCTTQFLPCCCCCTTDGLKLAADEAEGFFRVAQYGQVYTLQTRLNEMMLKVEL